MLANPRVRFELTRDEVVVLLSMMNRFCELVESSSLPAGPNPAKRLVVMQGGKSQVPKSD